MSGRGRVAKPGSDKGAAHLNYKCQVEGCTVTPRGNNVGRHYMKKTDWELVEKLRAAVGDSEVLKYLAGADNHTEFIFRRGYTKNRLPTFNTHATVKTVCQAGQGISRFLQVTRLK